MEVTGKVCGGCGVLKAFKDMVRNSRCSHGCEGTCKVCRDTKSKPQWQRRDRARTERNRAERKIKDDLWEETVQLEIDYYAKQVAVMRHDLSPALTPGNVILYLKECNGNPSNDVQRRHLHFLHCHDRRMLRY
jgi:hypothetical protein